MFHLHGVQNSSALKGVVKLGPEVFTGQCTSSHPSNLHLHQSCEINKPVISRERFSKNPNKAHQLGFEIKPSIHHPLASENSTPGAWIFRYKCFVH